MSEKIIPTEPNTVSCEECLKEIPESVAHSMEGEDYILHFCGWECYKKWKEQTGHETTYEGQEE